MFTPLAETCWMQPETSYCDDEVLKRKMAKF